MAVVLKTGRIDDGKRSHSGSLTRSKSVNSRHIRRDLRLPAPPPTSDGCWCAYSRPLCPDSSRLDPFVTLAVTHAASVFKRRWRSVNTAAFMETDQSRDPALAEIVHLDFAMK